MRAVLDQDETTLPDEILAIDPEIRAGYVYMRMLPDGCIVGVHRLIYHWTMHYGIDCFGYAGRYCFASYELAIAAAQSWDGTGDPEGWHKHPPTRRRRDVRTGEIWHEEEDVDRHYRRGRFARPEGADIERGPDEIAERPSAKAMRG